VKALPCKGILFDCDGVLVDSDASVLSAWRRWALDLGLDPERVLPLVHGRRSADTVAELLPAPDRAGALERIDRYEVDDAGSVAAVPGAVELLTSMPTTGWAVVTSGTYELATARLKAAGLPMPGVLVTADDVSAGKPDPEGYLLAAARLDLQPSATIVLEDAQAGIDAARAAGASAVVGVGRDGLRADVIVPDLIRLRWTSNGLIVN
jgi:mannitol-1-/sugar-/sorbitol-6-phosphatase